MEKKLKDMGVELNELAIAMCDYIQTGQKTEQLSKFWDNEDSFYLKGIIEANSKEAKTDRNITIRGLKSNDISETVEQELETK